VTDVSELRALSRDLGKVSGRAAGLVFGAVAASAQDMQTTWRRTAKAEARGAARRYPETIVVHPTISTNVHFEVYPDARVNGQANLGDILENGSPTSPPHLWVDRASAEVAPRLDKRLNDALAGIAAAIVSDKREYVTKSGRTVMATDAQIAHWTRGSL
jgi:hypothetical protein